MTTPVRWQGLLPLSWIVIVEGYPAEQKSSCWRLHAPYLRHEAATLYLRCFIFDVEAVQG